MNRSLEALAIFAICLGGILAAVRISTKDHASAGGAIVKQPDRAAEKDLPAKSSSSAAEATAERSGEFLAYEASYEAGCGFDRQTGQVYRPLSPLLSRREFAQRVIRSAPLPLIVLPDGEPLETSRSGYDDVYDDAVYGELVSIEELDYRQIEADYAAAELAAADESQESSISVAAWRAIGGQLRGWQTSAGTAQQYGRGYVVPIYRALEIRWVEQVRPRLSHFPRTPATARKNLLLRQRAESKSSSPVTWNDYLAFAERHLSEPAENKVAGPFDNQLTQDLMRHSSAYLTEAYELTHQMLRDAGERLLRVTRRNGTSSAR